MCCSLLRVLEVDFFHSFLGEHFLQRFHCFCKMLPVCEIFFIFSVLICVGYVNGEFACFLIKLPSYSTVISEYWARKIGFGYLHANSVSG